MRTLTSELKHDIARIMTIVNANEIQRKNADENE